MCALEINVCAPARVPVPSGHEEHLIPYSLVQPVQVQTKRPVIFSPSLLSRGLIERLLQPAESGLNFNTCPPGIHTFICTCEDPNTDKISEWQGWWFFIWPSRDTPHSPLCCVSGALQSLSSLQRDEIRECSCWIPAVQSRLWAYGCSQ